MMGPLPAILALFLYSLLPIYRNTLAGMQGIATPLRESAEALGLSRMETLRIVELPLAAPMILTGIKITAVINVGYAALGGLIGAGGYGQTIMEGLSAGPADGVGPTLSSDFRGALFRPRPASPIRSSALVLGAIFRKSDR